MPVPKNVLLPLLLAVLGSCAEGPGPLDCSEAGNAFLFSQPARSAVIEEEGGALRLTLADVGRTIWFSDRPSWDAGLIDTGAFLTVWDDFGIDEGAPGVVTVIEGDAVTSTTVALSDPVWNEDQRTLSYRVRELAEDRGVGTLAPGELGEVTVLLDFTVLARNCAPDLEPDVVFVQSGLSGGFSDGEGELELELHGVAQTQFFSSDPDRAGGTVETGAFVDDWAASGESARAVLDIPGRTDGPALIELEISHPRYEDGTLSFRVVDVQDEERSARALPEGFEDAGLFIDSVDSPLGGVIAQAIPEPVDLSDIDPATAFGQIYIVASEAISQAMENAANAQQQGNVSNQSSTTRGVSMLYSVDLGAVGVAVSDFYP
jgi:hypothetical protein